MASYLESVMQGVSHFLHVSLLMKCIFSWYHVLTCSCKCRNVLFKQHLANSPFGSVTLNLYMSIWMMMIIVIHYAIRSLKVGARGGALYSFQKIIPTQQQLLLQWKEIKQSLKICRMSCRTVGALLYRLILRLMNGLCSCTQLEFKIEHGLGNVQVFLKAQCWFYLKARYLVWLLKNVWNCGIF